MTTKYTEWNIEPIIALIVAFSFLASFCYLIGFFLEINVSHSSIPITISDILISFFYWVLPTFCFLVSILVFAKLSGLYDEKIPEEDIINSSKNPNRTKLIRQLPFYSIAIMSLVCITSWILWGITRKEGIYGLGFSFGFLIIVLHAKVNKLNYEKSRFIDLIKYPSVLFIFLMVSAITNGCIHGFQFINSKCIIGQEDNLQKDISYLITIFSILNSKNNDIDKNSNLIINSQCTRYFDRGVLVNGVEKMTFIPWENINKIRITLLQPSKNN